MEQVDNLNHKSTKVEAEEKIEVTMTNTVMTSEATITDIDQIVETEDNIDSTEVGLGTNKIIGEVISEVMPGILTDRIVEESIEIITGMKVMTEIGTSLEKGCFLGTLAAIEIGVQATVGPGQDGEPVQTEIE